MTDLALPPSYAWLSEPWGRALRCVPLDRVARHVFTTRDLPLEPIDEPRGPGWTALGRSLGVAADRVMRLRQVHGARAVLLRSGRAGAVLDAPPPEADILAADDESVALSVRVADCNAVLMADLRSGAVAAVHAGWRGGATRAVQAAVRVLESVFGSSAGDLIAAVGPSIGPCCYRVGMDVVEAFFSGGMTRAESARWFLPAPAPRREQGTAAPDRTGERDSESWELGASDFRLPSADQLVGFSRVGGAGAAESASSAGASKRWADLWTATADQLVAAGVRAESIHVAGLCTACHRDLFHSYRADQTTSRTAAAIRMRGAGN